MFSWAMRLLPLLRQGPLRAASPALIVYLDLFLAQVHLDDLLVLHNPLAQPDLLLEHDALGDHDLLFEDLQDDLVLADIGLRGPAGLPGLAFHRHPLDLYLLAPLRDPHHLALGMYALPGAYPACLALADAGAEFLFGALHPQVSFQATTLVGGRYDGAVRRSFVTSLVSQNGPFRAGSLCCERKEQGGHATRADVSPEEVLPLQSGAALGGVLYVYLLAPDVLLDDLGVFHNVLADADLFLGHGALVDHDLFLGDRHGHLVLANLGLGRLAAYRHPLDAYLLVLGGHLDALAVGPHALSDLHGAGLALAGA